MLLSLVINLESQKLVVKAVICPGTELPKCFRGNKELVLEVTTATLQPHPSPEGGRAGVCAMHRLHCTRGDSKASRANSMGILWGGIMEGVVFLSAAHLSLPCQSLLVAVSASRQSYVFAPAIAVKLTFTYPKQLAGIYSCNFF